MDEIFKIVCERNRKRQILNQRDIRRICNIIINSYDYNEEVHVTFDKSLPNNESLYAYTLDNYVIFFTEVMMKVAEEKYNLINRKFDGCKTDFFNHFILGAIFHEFTHVAQFDSIDRGKKNLETRLFIICNKLKKIKEFYGENYRFFIDEKQAFGQSDIQVYSIFSRMPQEIVNDRDKNFYAELAMRNLIACYEVDANKDGIISPSETLLYKASFYNLEKQDIDVNQFTNLVYKQNGFTLYKKLLLGLPVTFEEYAYANLIYDCIDEGQDVDFVKRLQRKL